MVVLPRLSTLLVREVQHSLVATPSLSSLQRVQHTLVVTPRLYSEREANAQTSNLVLCDSCTNHAHAGGLHDPSTMYEVYYGFVGNLHNPSLTISHAAGTSLSQLVVSSRGNV